jgi:hypothetical protein
MTRPARPVQLLTPGVGTAGCIWCCQLVYSAAPSTMVLGGQTSESPRGAHLTVGPLDSGQLSQGAARLLGLSTGIDHPPHGFSPQAARVGPVCGAGTSMALW